MATAFNARAECSADLAAVWLVPRGGMETPRKNSRGEQLQQTQLRRYFRAKKRSRQRQGSRAGSPSPAPERERGFGAGGRTNSPRQTREKMPARKKVSSASEMMGIEAKSVASPAPPVENRGKLNIRETTAMEQLKRKETTLNVGTKNETEEEEPVDTKKNKVESYEEEGIKEEQENPTDLLARALATDECNEWLGAVGELARAESRHQAGQADLSSVAVAQDDFAAEVISLAEIPDLPMAEITDMTDVTEEAAVLSMNEVPAVAKITTETDAPAVSDVSIMAEVTGGACSQSNTRSVTPSGRSTGNPAQLPGPENNEADERPTDESDKAITVSTAPNEKHLTLKGIFKYLNGRYCVKKKANKKRAKYVYEIIEEVVERTEITYRLDLPDRETTRLLARLNDVQVVVIALLSNESLEPYAVQAEGAELCRYLGRLGELVARLEGRVGQLEQSTHQATHFRDLHNCLTMINTVLFSYLCLISV